MVRITARLGGKQRAVLEPTANHRPRPLCPWHHRRRHGPNYESDQHDDLPPAPDAGRHRTAGNAINSVAAVTGPRRPQESLIAMAGILVTEQSLEKTLRQILELACAALPGGDEGGITLLEAEGPGTAIATSDVARRIDRSQYDAITGGPCLDAYRRQEIQRIDSIASDQRWPEFSGTAVAEGFASTLSIPLIVSGDGLGALNVYCHREYGFPAADERLAAALGSCASVALANARIYWRTARLADQLQEARPVRPDGHR
jgi:transcriptional regulator with GAF, ATPase, and Fis domain